MKVDKVLIKCYKEPAEISTFLKISQNSQEDTILETLF